MSEPIRCCGEADPATCYPPCAREKARLSAPRPAGQERQWRHFRWNEPHEAIPVPGTEYDDPSGKIGAWCANCANGEAIGADRPAGRDTGHRQTAAEVLPRHRGDCDWDWHTGPNGPGCTCGVETERDAIAAALAVADRDGCQRGREEMAREIGEWLDAADDVDLTTLTVEAVRRRIARALADRNDERTAGQ